MTARNMFALANVSTDEWGAVANYDPATHGGAREGNDQLFVHHPGTDYGAAVDAGDASAERNALRKIEKNAMSGEYWGTPYDIHVGQSGTIYAGRGLARSGATSGDVDKDHTSNNDEGEAVLVLISPNGTMTEACKASLARLFDAHGGSVIGHKDAGGIVTACPGDDRLKFIAAYKDGSVTPTPKPAPKPAKNWTKPENDYPTWTEELVKNLPTLKKRTNLNTATDDDRVAQGLLAAAGVLSISENTSGDRFDGKFGASTESAVKAFQKKKKLGVDGVIGKNTWTALLGGSR
jgi:hypothetical protein